VSNVPNETLFEKDIKVLAAEHRMRIDVVPQKGDVHAQFARDVADFIKAGNVAGRHTALILPVGPSKQYPLLADICNRESISWRHVHTFNMDEYLDWQGRSISPSHPLSFKGFMLRFFFLLHEELRIPEGQVHFPDPLHVDSFSERIDELGGIDCCYGGIGVHGHVAFNEPPIRSHYDVSVEQFKQSKTRIIALNHETIVMNSTRSAGGRMTDFPPMAITVGMNDIVRSRRIRLYCDGGEWQRTAVRQAIAGAPSVNYPVSLLRGHPDYAICLDEDTAQPAFFHI
jgi:glucosamine-6-phosphate deaminase